MTATVDLLHQRAFSAANDQDRQRFVGYADGLARLGQHPFLADYLSDSSVAAALTSHLEDLQRSDLGDVGLKAAVTCIHLTPCLGYWRANANVPDFVRGLLTPDKIYDSALAIAQARKSRDVDSLIGKYTRIVSELEQFPQLNLKVRGSIIWPWCRFAIEQVAYSFQRESVPPTKQDHEFTDVKLLQVLFNVFLDDAADNVQDPVLVRLLGRIPFPDGGRGEIGVVDGARHARLRRELERAGRPEFSAYLDLAIEVWNYTFERMRAISGGAFELFARELAADYARIVDSMHLSVDLNTRPLQVFNYDDARLRELYFGAPFGEILAHNSNRAGFFTMDLVRLRATDMRQYSRIEPLLPAYRDVSLLFQDMHQTGNSVATGAREAESQDLSNELFKIANDRLNLDPNLGRDMESNLLDFVGGEPRDALIIMFEQKKCLRRLEVNAPKGSIQRQRFHERVAVLNDQIEELVGHSGAERIYFETWVRAREKAKERIEQARIPDGDALLAGNDLLLVLHLIYKGRI
jgi:hypothetical protein